MSAAIISFCIIYLFMGSVVSDEDICIGLNKPYNTNTEICCRFSIEQRFSADRQELDCCYNKTFVPETHLCCDKSVVQRISDNGDKTKCCGGIQYNPKDQSKLCCYGNLHNKIHGEQAACCGRTKMDSVNEVCCKDSNGNRTIHQKQPNMKCCQRSYYNKKTHYCYHNRHVLPLHQGLCGTQPYDVRRNKCCGKTLHSTRSGIDTNYLCCGSEIYNKAEQKCCWKENSLISAQMSCCKGGPYDKEKELCCDAGPIKYNTNTEKCCGTGLYDSETQGCCGTKSYNISTHHCCLPNGAVIIKNSAMKCCGTSEYNSTTEVCCLYNDKVRVIQKFQGYHDSCCSLDSSDRVQSFSSKTHYCSLGTVVSYDKKMCGTSLIDGDKDLCCHGNFYQDGKALGKKCCGIKIARRCGKEKKRPNRIKTIEMRKSRNLEKHRICQICKKSKKYFLRSLRSKKFDICRSQAFKVRFVHQKSVNSNRKKIMMTIQKDLYSETDNEIEKKKIQVHLPCQCRLRTRRAILITHIDNFSRPLRLRNIDVLLPWSTKINKEVKKWWKKCIANTNDLN